jgi:hypothetical protein
MSGWGGTWFTEAAPVTKEAWDSLKPVTTIPKFLNSKPTHDPYTNPNAHIYYECSCGAILDPGTKSFANLNNHASNAGWKIRFSEVGYIPYCVKCGEDVE